MSEALNKRKYDLDERTFLFAKRVNEYVERLPNTISNIENGKQLVRSGGSVGANYIEASEAFSEKEKEYLVNEAGELMKIFGSIVTNAC